MSAEDQGGHGGRRARVITADHAGSCPGVQRALRMTEHALQGGPLISFGPLIHNRQVVERLEREGLRQIESLDEAEPGVRLLIRTHGVSASVLREARARGMEIIDATCPFVSRVHECARELEQAGYEVLVIGEPDHPEVLGITGSVAGRCRALDEPEEAERLPRMARVGCVAQTTQTVENYRAIVGILAARSGEIRAYNTLCDATAKRQEAARRLARQADVVLVVGGRHSANTRRLAQICEQAGARTYHIETCDEVCEEWLRGAEVIGVTAGASTPDTEIEAVLARTRELTAGQ
jgi:small subunit ribosomal protein S1